MRSSFLRVLALCFVAVLCLAIGESRPEDDPQPQEPISLGLRLDTSVSIALFDVEVLDMHGNPLPGLTKEDFEVKLNSGWQRPQSVDDLCPCGVDPSEEMDARLRSAGLDSRIYIFYFDFGQLQQRGLTIAVDQAKRWIRETMREGERVMIVGVTPRNGLEQISPLTSDRSSLTETLAELIRDPTSLTAEPNEINRHLACSDCGLEAGQIYSSTRYSLQTLLFFVSGLEEVEGRKALFLFHQNIVADPNRLFGSVGGGSFPSLTGPGPSRSSAGFPYFTIPPMPGRSSVTSGPTYATGFRPRVPDHHRLVEEIAGTAFASRTAVFPMFCGDPGLDHTRLAAGAVNFGANLADFTGGDYNRSNTDLAVQLDQAERGCRCLYRLGVMPRQKTTTGTHRLKVHVPGAKIGGQYRIRLYSEHDRWLRRARAVLSNPETAREIPLTGAIVPVAAENNRWTVRVEVAVDLKSFDLLSMGSLPQGNWAVGAVLLDADRGKNWEMLGYANLWTGAGEDARAIIVHDRVFEGLRPGKYELRAFVRDQWTRLMGGAEAEIVLPWTSLGGIVGPVRMRSVDNRIRMDLPGHSKKDRKKEKKEKKEKVVNPGPTKVDVNTGTIPVDGEIVLRGDQLVLQTWACNPSKKEPLRLARFLTRNGVGLFRFPGSQTIPQNSCREVVDPVNTHELEWGEYGYHVRQVGITDRPLYGGHSFTIVESTQIASAVEGPTEP